MSNLTLLDIYFFASISQVVLMFLAVYFAIQIIRKVGTFWAWTLMVVAFSILALHDFTSVASVLSTPEMQLVAKTEAFTITSYWPGAILDETAYGTLAIATFGLAAIFAGKAVDAPASPRAIHHKGIEAISLRTEHKTDAETRLETVSDERKRVVSRAKEPAGSSLVVGERE